MTLYWAYDNICLSETWWEESCNWQSVMGSYCPCRRNRHDRWNRGLALHLKEGLDFTVLAVGGHGVKSLWVGIKGKVNKTGVVFRVYCRLPRKDDTNALVYKKLQAQSKLVALVLKGDFSFPGVIRDRH